MSGRPTPTWALIAGGGTAGHLLPGLALARALVEAGHAPDSLHFVGSERGPEGAMVPQAGFKVDLLPGRGIQRRLTPANISALVDLARAFARGLVIVRKRRPAVVVVLGGYASAACGVGAVLCRVPIVLLEQNKKAGAVNRLLRRVARASAVSFAGTDLPRSVVTGNPLRPEIRAMAEHPDPAGARAALDLPQDRTVIGVFAGSLGSRRINEAVRGLVEEWGHRSDLAVRHVIGSRDFHDFMASAPQPPDDGMIYQPVRYEDRMHLLLDASDVAVTRAGGSVFELMAAGLPSILVPLPIATRDHQMANALAVAATGGSVVVRDEELDSKRLMGELESLLADPHKRANMSVAMRGAASVDAAERAAEVVEAAARG